MIPRLIPSTLGGDRRRAQPWREGSRVKLVPLNTAMEKGQEFEGKIVVPTRLTHAEPHTNQKLEFDRLVRENIDRWVEWRRRRGWEIASFPHVVGPYDVPTATVKDEVDPEVKWYFLKARFIRHDPLYVRLEDFLHEQEKAATYGIDLNADTPAEYVASEGDSGWVDPMKHAEERRQKLGLKREDFLFGPLNEPRGMTPPPGVGVNPL